MSSISSSCVRFLRIVCGVFTWIAISIFVTACGSGGGEGASSGGNSNSLLATQIAEIQPDNDTDTSSVFVQLGTSSSPSAGAQIISDTSRIELQNQFLADLEAATKPKVLLGISTSAPCDVTGFSQQLENAHKFSSDAVVRLDLTACQLKLLPSIPNVKGVFADLVLEHQATGTPSAQTVQAFAYLIQSIDFSFNSSSSRQINTSTIGAGAPKSADGIGTVIAVLDTGVEERHPALGAAKVLPGACFSTPSNGGTGFCSQGNQTIESPTNTDPNKRVARSCTGTGCEHGTAMASAIAMGANTPYPSVTVNGAIAPQAKILPIQVFNKVGNSISASSGDLLAALEWLVTEAQRRKSSGLAPIVAANLSLGGGSYAQNCDKDSLGALFNTVFAKLRALGVLPVVAAGNAGLKTSISFPACTSNAFSVAATQLDGLTPASYSNFNDQVKLFAIGGESSSNNTYVLPTLCTDGNNFSCWGTMAGTSPATALVSGGVAALSSLKPNATASEIENALITANSGSAKSVTINATTRPALRLTASGYKLIAMAEPSNPSPAPKPSPLPSTPVATQGRACFYPQNNYQGNPSCATFTYGNWDKWYRLTTRVGSVKIEPINGTAPAQSTRVTYFHYSFDYSFATRGVTWSESLPNTSSLGFWDKNPPWIFGVHLQSP